MDYLSNDAESQDDPKSSKDVVKINVDGTVYTFSRAKIARQPETMLAVMFSDRNECLATPNADGVYTFADRNGEAFAVIHQYYESDGHLNTAMLDILTGKIHLDIKTLKSEFDFFQIPVSDTLLWESAYSVPFKRIEAFACNVGMLIHHAIISGHDYASVSLFKGGKFKAYMGDSAISYHESDLFPVMAVNDIRWVYRVLTDQRFKKLQTRLTDIIGKELASSTNFEWKRRIVNDMTLSIEMNHILDYSLL
ncbi:hypothetical protein BC937DRAFT_93126 [Endogone sp. FLAS-F59071]|nr:hypothetical protein BC937DRAFT_93126 [Endogone sp. FLAS-F59071]|eukprot:RUS14944.1 hypothetical protein BC937DRAFT_93126 [Endogone sp. FLAS-F59071]